MKKRGISLSLAALICLLTACGGGSVSESPSPEPSDAPAPVISESPAPVTSGVPSPVPSDVPAPAESEEPAEPSKPAEPVQSAAGGTRTDVLYAVFYTDDVKEYPIEYTGAKKTAEELADALTELTGLDFFITASKTADGWIVDWSADSTLVAGLDDREQKEEFFFFDCDSLNWFMMDSLWRTLTENLDAENIYYTMDGGRKLFLEKMSSSINTFPADIPYMGSGFYAAHTDVRGDDETPYARTKGLWRLDGATDTASIEMNGYGVFTMYYASGAVEASGYLGTSDEYGDDQFDCYTSEGDWIASICLDSDTQLHIVGSEGEVYLLDTRAAYQGVWMYDDGGILEIDNDRWYLYAAGEDTPFDWGPVSYDEEAAYLMNEDGSSGGGKVYFDEEAD